MKGIIRLVIKFVVYVAIVIPLVRTVVGAIFGSGGFGWVMGIVAAIGLAVWLETTGTSNRLLAKLFGAVSDAGSGGSAQSAGSLFSEEPKGLETTMKCPNCGSQVTLINNHGKCRACDSAF
ncbi:MAG: hypothetical protein FWH16_01735 [Oscillospiraceae bacterium]|nr:hypothetical protein [Oscillospiraceae bacterium]